MNKIEINNETNELNFLFGGYFSGVGNITLYHSKGCHCYYLRVSCSFDNIKTANLFAQNFGGNIQKQHFPTNWGKKKLRRFVYWKLSGLDSMGFLNAIETYLIDNKLKAKLKIARKFSNYQQKNYKSHSDRVRKQKHKYYLQMRRLK